MYVACSWKLHNLLQNNNTKRLNKIEKVNTHIHDNSLSLLGAGISIKRGGVQPVLSTTVKTR
jgi:hypothetical protein